MVVRLDASSSKPTEYASSTGTVKGAQQSAQRSL